MRGKTRHRDPTNHSGGEAHPGVEIGAEGLLNIEEGGELPEQIEGLEEVEAQRQEVVPLREGQGKEDGGASPSLKVVLPTSPERRRGMGKAFTAREARRVGRQRKDTGGAGAVHRRAEEVERRREILEPHDKHGVLPLEAGVLP